MVPHDSKSDLPLVFFFNPNRTIKFKIIVYTHLLRFSYAHVNQNVNTGKILPQGRKNLPPFIFFFVVTRDVMLMLSSISENCCLLRMGPPHMQ